MFRCVCVCACECEGERERERGDIGDRERERQRQLNFSEKPPCLKADLLTKLKRKISQVLEQPLDYEPPCKTDHPDLNRVQKKNSLVGCPDCSAMQMPHCLLNKEGFANLTLMTCSYLADEP